MPNVNLLKKTVQHWDTDISVDDLDNDSFDIFRREVAEGTMH